ncbi:hypothetical protein C922_02258 [Plasmodium inui San Antonio 1]|uniref:Pv-fam-h protein n=1 Tax=Plasmodium inui San Antonio 1 TaxID=1237626 RepID=W7A2W4_9APIC|nr:hypothetical protein C922_02258 [Plasmodium inui San Antonio 1]EUD67552.1 hypothetical protein C922_02258 [Plasmodium inui San Antonio 1]
MIFGKTKKIAYSGEEPTDHLADSSNNDGADTTNNSGRAKIVSVFSASKVLTFALLLWLVQCSIMCSGGFMGDHYNRGRTAAVRSSRLLGQPFVQFDDVFDLYQKSFLDKMGCDSNQQDQIRTMMKSYFDKIDFEALAHQFQQNPCSILQCPPGIPTMAGMTGTPGIPGMSGMPGAGGFLPEFPGMCEPSNLYMPPSSDPEASKEAQPKKKEGEQGTSNDGDEQETGEEQNEKRQDQGKKQITTPTDNSKPKNLSQYLNFFNFLSSPSFLISSSVISAYFGQFHVTMAALFILFLKTLNFFWNLKMMHDMLFPKPK